MTRVPRPAHPARLALPMLFAAELFAGPAPALDLVVGTRHHVDDGLPTELIDEDSERASPVAPGATFFALSTGEQYRVVASADELGNSAVGIETTSVSYQSDVVQVARVDAAQVHLNPFPMPARASFRFILPQVGIFAFAANADLLYEIEIAVDRFPRWRHQGIMEFDEQANVDWRWAGEDIGAPAPGPTNEIEVESFVGTVDLGVFLPGERFELQVSKHVQLEHERPGYIEIVRMYIGDPDDLSLSPFLGEVTMTPIPEPASGALLALGLVVLAARARRE